MALAGTVLPPPERPAGQTACGRHRDGDPPGLRRRHGRVACSIEGLEGGHSRHALSVPTTFFPAVDEERKRFLRGVAEGLRAQGRKRSAHLDHMRREWRAAGLAEAHRLTKCFVEADPDLRKVVLFGSLATGEVGHREPDIDLAVDLPTVFPSGLLGARQPVQGRPSSIYRTPVR